jgi:hypothetical protein
MLYDNPNKKERKKSVVYLMLLMILFDNPRCETTGSFPNAFFVRFVIYKLKSIDTGKEMFIQSITERIQIPPIKDPFDL